MRLKTKLVLAITGLVFLVVTLLSWLFLEQLLAQRIRDSYAANDMVARQILYSTQLALNTGLQGRQVDPNNPASLRATVLDVLQHDEGLNGLLSSVNRYASTVFDVAIADRDGKALLSTDPAIAAKVLDVELYQWYGSAALPMYMPYHEQVQKKSF